VHLVYNCITNQHDVLFSPPLTVPLHLQGSFLAHHQEAECIMWWIVLVLLLNRLSVGLVEPIMGGCCYYSENRVCIA
jgi:hypothetical protein